MTRIFNMKEKTSFALFDERKNLYAWQCKGAGGPFRVYADDEFRQTNRNT